MWSEICSENVQCHQWQQRCQIDDLLFSANKLYIWVATMNLINWYYTPPCQNVHLWCDLLLMQQVCHSSSWDTAPCGVQGGTLESKLFIGNIYRPPRHNNNNATIENFLNEITPVISNIAKNNCNIVISGDFNIDLLQINERVKYQKYFDAFVTNSLFPLITLPTRESKHSSTLIDQIFCKLKNFSDLDSSGILKSNLSDHYPCFAILDICKKNKHKPKFITINNKNEQSLQLFCTEVSISLNKWQINNDLMTNPNENYNIFEKIILEAKAKHLSPKTVRFKKYKHKISPWINSEILRLIKERDDLH